MKRKFRSATFRHRSKEEIIKKARRGVFDSNPLLATSHDVVCKTCGCVHKITYLDHLRSGRFELGETQLIEVSYAAPTVLGLRQTMERATPIIITIRCRRCEAETSYSPVSLEYLLFTAARRQKLKSMYV